MRPETYETPAASPWTDARVERLKELWNTQEYSCAEIAADLGGTTRNAVIGKVTRLGLQLRRNRTTFTSPRVKRQKASHTIRKNGAGYVPLAPNDEPGALDVGSLHEIEAQAKPVTFLGITLLKLQDKHCRYPRGEGINILFCGQPAVEGRSYCASCSRRVYQRAA